MAHRICFISDIHWRGNTRHIEYTGVFNRLFRQLREEVKPDSIVIGGDIFHTKTQGITPEVIDKIRWMFEELADIAPVYSILGNHDGNLENNTRQDTISPIVTAMDSPRVLLFKRSGNHIIPNTNINLCVLSPFDVDGWKLVQTDEDLVNVALFHGSVRGCEVDSDWVMSGAEVNLDFFRGYDFALLGDIHKTQFLDYRSHGGPTRELKPWIGYPGSLIQQNYGELPVKGYHVWDIEDADNWDVQFKSIPNPYQFVTVEWQGEPQQTVDALLELVNGALENKRVRISSHNSIVSVHKQQLSDQIKSYGASEVVFKTDKSNAVSEHDNHAVTGKDKSLRNDPEHIYSLYEDYLHRDYKSVLTDEQKQQAKDFVFSALRKVRETEEDDVRDVVWSLRSLEFSNLYRYGKNNNINFDNLQGIVGLFAENQMGKSSVVGSLMFSLFNTTDRGPVKSSYIINKNERWGEAKAIINVGGVDYVVHRTIEKAKRRGGLWDDEKAATKLTLSKVVSNDDETVDLSSENGETRNDTDKQLRKLIGTAQDFTLTSLSAQDGMHKFINEGPTQRKAILNRFLDLDIFEKLFKVANEELTVVNAKASKWQGQGATWDQRRQAIHNAVAALNTTTQNLTQKKTELLDQRDTLLKELQSCDTTQTTQLEDKLRQANLLVLATKSKLAQEQETLQASSSQLKDTLKRIQDIDILLAATDKELLLEKKRQLDLLRTKHSELKGQLKQEQTKLESMERSVKKLTVVPCGDSYPTCLYIKDSHADKQQLEQQKQLAESVVAAYSSLETEFQSLLSENIDKQLQNHSSLSSEKLSLGYKVESLTTLVSSKETVIGELTTKLTAQEENKASLELELAKMSNTSLVKTREALKNTEQELRDVESELVKAYKAIGAKSAEEDELSRDEEEAKQILHKQRVLDSITQAFSKTGIPTIVLKHKLPEINDELENILAGIAPFRIYLKTETDSNNLDVFIEDDNSTRVIELASGMEKVISSLALRVALLSLSSLPKPDMFIVDEGWGALSSANRAKAIELLNSLKARFKLVFVISHIDEIKEAADTIITIKDVGGRSSITF